LEQGTAPVSSVGLDEPELWPGDDPSAIHRSAIALRGQFGITSLNPSRSSQNAFELAIAASSSTRGFVDETSRPRLRGDHCPNRADGIPAGIPVDVRFLVDS